MQLSSCFFHPITVLLLDDNKNFLLALELELQQHGNIISFDDPKKAYDLINASKQDVNSEVFTFFDKREIDTTTDCLVDMKINKLHQLIYNRSRFDVIAVLVVDYQMPSINGIEFCRSIQDKPMCKIMLTAEDDKDLAIQAFNDGVIDKFLLKRNEHLYADLVAAIEQSKQRYFHKKSEFILEHLGASLKLLLAMASFQRVFNDIFQRNNVVEYYLIDTQGSFLFLDQKGTPTWLIIRNDAEINDQISLLKGLEASEEMINFVKNREKILFLFSEYDYKKPIDQWASFLLDAKKLDDGYYYSVMHEKITDAINWEKMVAYN